MRERDKERERERVALLLGFNECSLFNEIRVLISISDFINMILSAMKKKYTVRMNLCSEGRVVTCRQWEFTSGFTREVARGHSAKPFSVSLSQIRTCNHFSHPWYHSSYLAYSLNKCKILLFTSSRPCPCHARPQIYHYYFLYIHPTHPHPR